MKKHVLKSFVLFALLSSSIAINAQSFSVSLDLPSSNLSHSRSRLTDDGSVISVIYDMNTASSHVVKISHEGTRIWGKTYQGTRIDDVKELPSGNLAFAAHKDFYFSVWGVLDPNGNLIWAKQLYSYESNYDLASLDLLASGKILFNFSKYSSSITVRCDEGGNTEDCDEGEDTLGMGKNPSFDSFGCDDSGYVTCDKSDDRIMIIRHNAEGDVMWAKNYMKASTEYFHLKKIQEMEDGSLMGVGLVSDSYTGPNNRGFIIKMDNTGEVLWTKKYVLPSNPGYFSSTFRNFEIEGNTIYISGYYTTDNMNMNNFFIQMDENGDVVSSKQMVNTSNALNWSLVPTMGSVTFEHDMMDHHLVYNNYNLSEGITSVEINKVNFDGLLGCEVIDFPVATISYNAIASTQPANYNQTSILETAPENITSASIVITNSDVVIHDYCAELSGIDDQEELSLSVYPNPASEYLNISGLNSNRSYNISIIDLTGKLVQVTNGIKGVELTTIQVGGLKNGSYLINVTDLSATSSVQLKWMKM